MEISGVWLSGSNRYLTKSKVLLIGVTQLRPSWAIFTAIYGML
jgi:hypothetical protein